MKLSRTFTFDAAHKLPNYEGKCKYLHGHTWKVRYVIEGPKNKKTGMIIDFLELKINIEQKIMEKLDHTYLNDKFDNPTAENIVEWMFEFIVKLLQNKENIALIYVEVWESPDSSAILTCSDYRDIKSE